MKEILISSSVLILVILLLRRLCRGRVSQQLVYAAWLLVALRLVIPVQFGQSQYSVTALTEKIESSSQPIQQAQNVLQEPVSGPSRAELYEQLANDYIRQGADPAIPEVQAQIELQIEERITAPTLSEILTAVWIGGIAIMAVWFLVTNLVFLRRAKRDSEVFECDAPVRVRLSPHVSSPCLIGLFRPVIYLTPASVESPQSLRHILTHEITHLRHGDHVWSLVRCVCLCVYWFDPLVWVAAILSKRDCELACDESALKKLGDGERIPYGKTLLATVTHSLSPAHLLETATAMNETKMQLKERVNFIVKKPKTILIAAICLILVAAITAGCAFVGSKSDEPVNTEPSVTEPATSQPQQTEPAVSGSTEPAVTDSTDPPGTEPPSEEETIAQELIQKYNIYNMLGIFCDYEYISADMSEYLTDTQKENYFDFQYRITCCRTADEVHNHIHRKLDTSLVDEIYPDDQLFWDDEGNLYLIVLPTGAAGYYNIRIIQHTDTQILAYADYGYDTYEHSAAFVMELADGEWMIKEIRQLEDP